MQTPLDQAITDAAAAEATYTADQANVASLQSSIATATAPLAPAQDKASADGQLAKAAYLALAKAAQDAAGAIPDVSVVVVQPPV